jgi:hypothetical protein
MKESPKEEECINCAPGNEMNNKPWYKERIFIVGFITITLVVVSYFYSPLNPLFNAFADYFKLIWWAILLGLLIGGIIDHFVPREYIAKILAAHRKRSIFYAVGLGFLMSACSHGILAIAIELYKKGASIPSVVAFLLASPWANLPITILLFGFFGWKALLLVGSAIVIAIITGFIFRILDKKGKLDKHKYSLEIDSDFSIKEDFKKRLKNKKWNRYDFHGVIKGGWNLAKMVVWWILIGMILAAFARAFVPQDIFLTYLGPTVLGLVITLIFATIIEVCSEGSSVLAFEIFNQTGAFGNSFVFLMAGVATDYTEIGLIWSNIGRKTAIWLPVVTVPQIIILGFLFNYV